MSRRPIGPGPPPGVRPPRPLDGVGRLARALLAQGPRQAAVAAATHLRGQRDVRFIPLLHVAGMGGTGAAANPVRDAAAHIGETLGVELTWPALLPAFVLLAALRVGRGVAARDARGRDATRIRRPTTRTPVLDSAN